jgi:hypothetical protein
MIMYVQITAVGIIHFVLASMAGSPAFAISRVINDSFYNAMLWLNPNGISALLDNIHSANVYTSIELLTSYLVYPLLTVALFVLC